MISPSEYLFVMIDIGTKVVYLKGKKLFMADMYLGNKSTGIKFPEKKELIPHIMKLKPAIYSK